ncbi:BatA domain-containing protein [Sphingomonas baiyangensis]|uniref:Aerotolerance regulator N-terminal domain-containing protein n=1 Tax=Sphingomonas baiyangensis TaxID=2572576 RepID=A0A4U1L0H2_9SPHN|nr:BatA domain-containing protein [Sphingomonas baiyangensis]TKD50251.1 hypothetical protein FBR43_05370 [Sphingomonas baiyangensis]
MNPALLFPAALAALAALAIPIVIHIARRTETRMVDFAALRWLDPRPQPRRRLRIDERLLLALRLLLLAAVALWLARPVFWGVAGEARVVAVAPGLTPPTIAADARGVWLAQGFPLLESTPPASSASITSLIRQLDAELPRETELELIVPPLLDGVDAERPRLSRAAIWRVAEGARPAPAATPTPLALLVRHDAGGRAALRYLRAAAIAWAGDARPAFAADSTDTPIPDDTRLLAWLAEGPMPERVVRWIEAGGTALVDPRAALAMREDARVVWRDDESRPIATESPLGRGRIVRLLRAIEPASMPVLLEPDFPDQLARVIAPPPPPARVAASEHAPVAGLAPWPQPPFDLRPWLAIVIALLFAIERWLATSARRAAAP